MGVAIGILLGVLIKHLDIGIGLGILVGVVIGHISTFRNN
ncbi:hypothetical protein AWRIB429_1797 [Oenococcus oeni AWRIB429]|uniref:Uncharacterized protein n=1 Tax=Oenococcus oeni AWRIB429 TaxID=655225 RepID=D3LBR7_OENOE|nr:hypothetical protein AWRIB429_1797 [Oenococcus oeni AWRIB429]KZD13197.1 hypothetical protein AC229_1781 [Oenococcus oeni]SYW20442.1 conserved hypothetical protein [Oenococcus oeni]